MYVCMYIISGVVLHANIFQQSCAQIDNNQKVYEAQIQVPRCNSILKAGSHECQNLRPLHLDRCTHTVPRQLILMSVCCLTFGQDLAFGQVFPPLTKYFLIHYSYLHSILLLLSSILFLYFQRSHTSDNDQITYLGFTFVLRKELLPLYFFVILFQVGKISGFVAKQRQFFFSLD